MLIFIARLSKYNEGFAKFFRGESSKSLEKKVGLCKQQNGIHFGLEKWLTGCLPELNLRNIPMTKRNWDFWQLIAILTKYNLWKASLQAYW